MEIPMEIGRTLSALTATAAFFFLGAVILGLL